MPLPGARQTMRLVLALIFAAGALLAGAIVLLPVGISQGRYGACLPELTDDCIAEALARDALESLSLVEEARRRPLLADIASLLVLRFDIRPLGDGVHDRPRADSARAPIAPHSLLATLDTETVSTLLSVADLPRIDAEIACLTSGEPYCGSMIPHWSHPVILMPTVHSDPSAGLTPVTPEVAPDAVDRVATLPRTLSTVEAVVSVLGSSAWLADRLSHAGSRVAVFKELVLGRLSDGRLAELQLHAVTERDWPLAIALIDRMASLNDRFEAVRWTVLSMR